MKITTPMTLALVAIASLAACKAIWNFEAEAELVGQKGKVKLQYDGTDINVDELPGEAKVDMEFTDEDGNPIPPGASGVGEGNKVTPPPGATTVVVTGPSSNQGGCSGCSAMLDLGNDLDDVRVAHATFDRDEPVVAMAGLFSFGQPQQIQHSGGQQSQRVAIQPSGFVSKWVQVETFIPDYEGDSLLGNVRFHADVIVPDTWTALDIFTNLIRPIIVNGAGYPVPNGPGLSCEIEQFTKVVPNGFTLGFAGTGGSGSGTGIMQGFPVQLIGQGMRVFTMDVTEQFDLYDLTINGTPVADNSILQTSNHYAAPNGWRVVEVNVPDSLLNYSSTSASLSYLMHTQTPEDPIVLTSSSYSATWE